MTAAEDQPLLPLHRPPADYPNALARAIRLFTGPPVCPPHIDPSPRYNALGERVFLDSQRAPTINELIWTFLTIPLIPLRRRHLGTLSPAELLRQAPYLRDPTIIVPTVENAYFEPYYTTFDPALVDRRIEELEARQERLDSENTVWLANRPWLRYNRTKRLDKRMKWDKDGRPVFLFMRRQATWWETGLGVVAFPWYLLRCWVAFGSAMRKSKKEKGKREAAFDVRDVWDPTVVIPTGKSLYLEEELLDERPQGAIDKEEERLRRIRLAEEGGEGDGGPAKVPWGEEQC